MTLYTFPIYSTCSRKLKLVSMHTVNFQLYHSRFHLFLKINYFRLVSRFTFFKCFMRKWNENKDFNFISLVVRVREIQFVKTSVHINKILHVHIQNILDVKILLKSTLNTTKQHILQRSSGLRQNIEASVPNVFLKSPLQILFQQLFFSITRIFMLFKDIEALSIDIAWSDYPRVFLLLLYITTMFHASKLEKEQRTKEFLSKTHHFCLQLFKNRSDKIRTFRFTEKLSEAC